MFSTASHATPRPGRAAWAHAFLRDAGLLRPTAQWTRDRHWRAALWAALPVWLGLGLLTGPFMRAPMGLWAWVSLALVQPVLEELTLRGLSQGLLLQWWGPRTLPRMGQVSAANLVTTAAFVALHLASQPWAWALAVAAPSLVLGHLRERLGSAWPGVLLHAFYNVGFGAMAWAAR